MFKSLGTLLLPCTVLIPMAFLPTSQDLVSIWSRWSGAAPWLVIGAGSLLGWRFDRSRTVWGLAILGGLGVGLENETISQLERGPEWLALLAMWGLVGFALSRDRRLLTGRGAIQALMCAGCVFGMLHSSPSGWLSLADARWMEEGGIWFSWLGQRSPTFVFGSTVALVALLLWQLKSRRVRDLSFLGAGVVTLLVIDSRELVDQSRAYLTGGTLLLVTALIQEAWGLAYLDDLTGLPGRRALNEELGRLGRRYSLAMLDVDHFKKFNDRHGHEVGDQVLRMVASRMQGVSSGGRPFRYGGEEFCIVFHRRHQERVVDALEDLRFRIEESRLTLRSPDRPKRRPKNGRGSSKKGKSVSVTVSIGVAKRWAGARPAEVLKRADKALYRAKRRGRNQVCTG